MRGGITSARLLVSMTGPEQGVAARANQPSPTTALSVELRRGGRCSS